MRIFFDHNVPHKLRSLLPEHVVRNARETGWAELENGTLLRAVEDGGFHLMITCDQNLSYQQNLKGRRLALVVITTNNWKYIRPAASLLIAAVSRATSGSFEEVEIRRPKSRANQPPKAP